jgi:20S proteasome subunit beta 2
MGFDFGNHIRNAHLQAAGLPAPKATSTGTTIVGLIYKDGVVLGADTRATAGPIVADKNCEKIHHIAPNIWCGGAGTAADTEFVTGMISSQLELHAMSMNRQPRVVTAMTLLKQHLFKYQGHVGAYLIVGGVDPTGPHLMSIHAHGSTDKLPYTCLGSGSLAAMAIFETRWRKDMERDEAVELVADAIKSGIFNDLGSGSNVDVAVITKEGTEVFRGYEKPNERGVREERYLYKRGTTRVLGKEQLTKFVTIQTLPVETTPSAMEVDA